MYIYRATERCGSKKVPDISLGSVATCSMYGDSLIQIYWWVSDGKRLKFVQH